MTRSKPPNHTLNEDHFAPKAPKRVVVSSEKPQSIEIKPVQPNLEKTLARTAILASKFLETLESSPQLSKEDIHAFSKLVSALEVLTKESRLLEKQKREEAGDLEDVVIDFLSTKSPSQLEDIWQAVKRSQGED